MSGAMSAEALRELLDTPHVARGLFLVRIADIDPELRFHRELLYSLEACQPGASDGELITAIRFTVGQAKADYLEERTRMRRDAKVMMAREIRTHRAAGASSQAVAKRLVEEDEAYWDLKMGEELADARAQACTDLLFALQAATDTWRTTRADHRAADGWHARTGT